MMHSTHLFVLLTTIIILKFLLRFFLFPQLWVGTKGKAVSRIYIYNTDTGGRLKELQAHDDTVRSLCAAELRYVISGAGSQDGKIAVWTPKTLEDSDKTSELTRRIV